MMKKKTQKQVLLSNGKSVVLINRTDQLKSSAGSEATMVELTDAELQAVSGGSIRSGGGGGNFDK